MPVSGFAAAADVSTEKVAKCSSKIADTEPVITNKKKEKKKKKAQSGSSKTDKSNSKSKKGGTKRTKKANVGNTALSGQLAVEGEDFYG